MSRKSLAGLIALIVFSLFLYLYLKSQSQPGRNQKTKLANTVDRDQIYAGVSYVPTNPDHFHVILLADHLLSPSSVKLVPDSNYLLVTQLSGTLIAFRKVGDDSWADQVNPVTSVATNFPGFPSEEGGLTALTLSSDFAANHLVFLFYSYKNKDGRVLNRIAKTTLKEVEGQLTGSPPEIIYESNTPGPASSQIREGIAVTIQDRPHLLFTISENDNGQLAQDSNMEVGKLMLIQENGQSPLGERPYSNPKIQALGIKNVFAMSQNPFDFESRILLADSGPEKYDRLIYHSMYEKSGKEFPRLNFGWDTTTESLLKNVTASGASLIPDPVIYNSKKSLTFTSLAFHSGGVKGIPKSDKKTQSVLVTVFGKADQPDPSPGKEIWLGRLNLPLQPSVSFSTIIKRSPNATGKLGNPTDLEVESRSGNFFFLDILEGRLYMVKPK